MLFEIRNTCIVADAIAVGVIANPSKKHLSITLWSFLAIFAASYEAVLLSLNIQAIRVLELVCFAVGDGAAKQAIVSPFHSF